MRQLVQSTTLLITKTNKPSVTTLLYAPIEWSHSHICNMFWPSVVYPQGVFKIVTYPFCAHKSVLPEAGTFRVVWNYNKSKAEGWYLPFWHGSVAWGACGTCHHRRDRRSDERTYHSVQLGWSIHRDHSESHLLVLHLLQDINKTSVNTKCLNNFFITNKLFQEGN